MYSLLQCCGSWIRCHFDHWIQDPDCVKIKIRIRDEYPESYFRELRNNSSDYKIPKFFNLDPDPEIFLTLDTGWKKIGSGTRDKHSGSATLVYCNALPTRM